MVYTPKNSYQPLCGEQTIGQKNEIRETSESPQLQSGREMIVMWIKVVTKMTVVQIRSPLRGKGNAINHHELRMPWENQMVAVQVMKT